MKKIELTKEQKECLPINLWDTKIELVIDYLEHIFDFHHIILNLIYEEFIISLIYTMRNEFSKEKLNYLDISEIIKNSDIEFKYSEIKCDRLSYSNLLDLRYSLKDIEQIEDITLKQIFI
jgi:hypothetical protein